MTCPSCHKEVAVDSFFCAWCDRFIPVPEKGTKANLFARWVALMIDPLIAVVLWFVAGGVFGAISPGLGITAAMLFPLIYLIWFISQLRHGMTPGKRLLGLRVINSQTGQIPGFGKMFLREIVGRIVSGLFLGLGYFWAIFDKNGQAWHDKLAGTFVVKAS
jgi:uncharacterized RDD family membrane protein YckC